ncbi:uncharacterized protein BDZ99DRAFT_572903 [Mytilinidion resinicola]|uniref:Uncharacterized protein n=1 Tax=Mytilinidion resinicola TaxID=574789 RepID=A0A6A6YJ70_9PEZI|nr:uncharacterized protein BDZ99DRAFT_572903 [Mytilinidion resinicola]KAF2808034.1 hypothetical protein BDZ99DRAFT_572903 [Mytilinidion resinicola]
MEDTHHTYHPFTPRETNPSPTLPFRSRTGFERRYTDFPLPADWLPHHPFAEPFLNDTPPYWSRPHNIHRELPCGPPHHPSAWSRRRGHCLFFDPLCQRPAPASAGFQPEPWWAASHAQRGGSWEDMPWASSAGEQSSGAVPDQGPDIDMGAKEPGGGGGGSSGSSGCRSGCGGFEHVSRGGRGEGMAAGWEKHEGDEDGGESDAGSDSSQSEHATFIAEDSFPTMPAGGDRGFFEPPRSGSRQSVHEFFGEQADTGTRVPRPVGEFPPEYTEPPRFQRAQDAEGRGGGGEQQAQGCGCSCSGAGASGMGYSLQDEMIAARLEELEAREARVREVEATLRHAEEILRQERERVMHAEGRLRQEKAGFEAQRNPFRREWRRQQQQSRRQRKPSYHFTDSDFDMLSSDDEEPTFNRGPPFFGWNGFSAQREPSLAGAEQAFGEYNTHWDQLSIDDAAIRYPTPSGSGGDLLDVGSRYMQQITSSNRYAWAPKLPNSNLPIHPHQVVRHNIFGFFIAAFGIRLRYAVLEGLENGSSPQWRPDFRRADQEKLKKLRDHLRRKEQKRWHPDQMNRRKNGFVGLGGEVFSRGGISMTGRELREAICLAITDLRQAYVETALREQ